MACLKNLAAIKAPEIKGGETLRRSILGLLAAGLILLAGIGAVWAEVTITGAGATFPYPLYSRWAHKYQELTKVKLNYQSIGSGGGIAQIKAKTVDFGASDEVLKPEDLKQSGLIQFPTVIGGVVPIVNLPGIAANAITLSPEVLADIFLGKIKTWDDAALAKLNPKVKLPKTPILIVHRADGSGTTWIFTHYLSQVSPEWKEKVGYGKSVNWPTGVGGKGNEGVAANVKQTVGAIGYVEYAYASLNNLTTTKLINQAGKAVEPNLETFQAAAAGADWSKVSDFGLVLTNQPGEKSWPICGATFILMHREQADAAKGKEVLKFFDWCYQHGDKIAEELHYVPLPAAVKEMIRKYWSANVMADGKPLWP